MMRYFNCILLTDNQYHASNSDSVELLLNKFENIKNHFKKGYKIRYTFDEEFVKDIESEIIIDNTKLIFYTWNMKKYLTLKNLGWLLTAIVTFMLGMGLECIQISQYRL